MPKEVEVRKSKINKKGVFALKDFRKGETVLKWDLSVKLTKKQAEMLPEKEKHYLYFIKKNEYLLEQPPERYVNHSCNANTTVKNFCDIAIKDIKKGEEITADYSKEETIAFEMKCSCMEKNCKKIIKGGTQTI